MRSQKLMTALATVALLGVPAIAGAQTEEHEQHHPQADAAPPAANAESESGTPPGSAASAGTALGAAPQMMDGQMMGPDMMGAGMSDMMGTDMMRMMHRMMGEGSAPIVIVVPVPASGGEAMRQGMMQRDMMPGMMDMMGNPRPGMARRDMAQMGGDGGSADLTYGVVKPAMHLSTADVRHFLEHRLESHGNPRLAVGEVTEAGEDAITADIVTADGSLVERLSVDRHSGAIVRVP
jgi:hypothetical protein